MKKLAVLGYDGVLFLGSKPVSGAASFVDDLRSHGFDVKVVCNNSRMSTSHIHASLAAAGISIPVDDIVSGAKMTIAELKKGRHTHVCVLGEPEFCEELRSNGISVISTEMHEKVATEEIELVKDATAVVVAVDTAFDFHKAGLMTRYCCEQHCALYSVGGDRQFPGESGAITPGAYALAVPVSVASYAPIHVIGKPEVIDAIDFGSYQLIVVIGDNPQTDIEFASRIRAKSVLLLSGLVEPEKVPKDKATFVCKDLSETIRNVTNL